jgi:hypothetical protein
MKMKLDVKIITRSVLLLFVIASASYAVVKELRKSSKALMHPAAVAEMANKPENATQTVKQNTRNNQIIAYYFHGKARCQTCLRIEKYAYSAITDKFEKEIQSGLIDWRVVDVEEPANSHFVKDYQLYSKSLVFSLVAGGKERKWKNLEEVWEYVQDEAKFRSYVAEEMKIYLAELPHD